MQQEHSHKNGFWLRKGMACFVYTVVVSGMILLGRPAFAETVPDIVSGTTIATTASSPLTENFSDSFAEFTDRVIGPAMQYMADQLMFGLAEFAANKIAYDAAVAIVSAGKGEEPLMFTAPDRYFEEYGADILGEGIGILSEGLDEIDVSFNLCAPQDPLILLSLQVGIKQGYKPGKPKCDWRSIKENWEGFANSLADLGAEGPEGDARRKQMLNSVAKGLRPGNNEIGAAFAINAGIRRKQQAAGAKINQQIAESRFKDATDFVTGKVKSPRETIEAKFHSDTIAAKRDLTYAELTDALGEDPYIQILKMAGSTFTNTLLAQATDWFFTGILPDALSGLNRPLDILDDIEGVRTGGRESAREQLAAIFAPSPFVSITDYSVLAEFSSCPTGNFLKRNLNNCVMDSGFFQAVAGKKDTVMTVQEALDANLLHGEWPLVSSRDNADNQDVNCYQRAYCLGNLVKLRKARVISSGWEIAAEKSYGANRATLQEVVDGFNNCNSQGKGDDTHPWCHLIDPNWVLKYPQTQCNAFVNGEIIASSIGGTRTNVCADAPSCVEEDNNGNCTGGYGYCTREENTWRFPGEACPDRYASCYAFENTFSGERKSLLFNTVETGVCNAGNAGCMWYAQEKPAGAGGARAFDEAGERIYLNNDAGSCAPEAAGCTQVYDASAGLRFNLVQNPSFSTHGIRTDTPTPDYWMWSSASTASSYDVTAGNVVIGSRQLSQRNIRLSPNAFYTFSIDAKGVGAVAQTNVLLSFTKATAAAPAASLSGTSFGGDCVPVNTGSRRTGYVINREAPTSASAKFTCTFTTNDPLYMDITLDASFGSSQVVFDNVQLEAGERATGFFEKYAGTQRAKYYKLPPAELGCRGLPTDHADCKSYAGMCSAQDVGCTLYTPEDGDQPVPAVASPLDICPNECVGYTSFKQVPTDYDTEDQLFYFIADKAVSCSAQDVGCDRFTNLDSVAAGGEGIETYTDLRACLTEELSGARAATYYTWEGSDKSGYQLKTWRLLKTNVAGSNTPCTNWQVTDAAGAFTLTCVDTSAASPVECDEHQDIFDNPDCREFYDTEGRITYQLFSETVTVSNECHPYRKTVSDQGSCIATGGLWVAAGECRYFGLPSESVSCPVAASGCREYIGGAGRNQVTVLYDNFEDSAVAADYETTNTTVRPSNESLAAGGHSLSVQLLNNAGSVQTKAGALASFVDTAVSKTYFLEFWAKGSGAVTAQLVDGGTTRDFSTATALSGDWKKFVLGPIAAVALGDNTMLRIKGSTTGQIFYVDNLSLRQTVDTVTVIKNSWVVPASCDETPQGIPAPQYYLGCAAYTSSETGERETYHQFNRLCSEQKVGCKPFFDTQNSESAYSEVFQARCHVSATDHNATATDVTACPFNGVPVCTIAVGRSFCVFDLQEDILDPTLTTTTDDDRISFGPEFVRVSNDAPVFLVDNGTGQCAREQMGCEEVGRPVWSQDKSRVNSFESATLLNLPDKYDQTLCEEEALFCEEWATTLDGNFYFKDPASKTCEWKTGVTIGGRQTNGWFRTGTNEPCYWTDRDPSGSAVGPNGRYDYGFDEAYLVDGEQFEVWRNGDASFDGWAATCESRYDMCTEFVDASDAREYHFINDDSLRLQDSVAAGQRCAGDVSQKFGCAALDNAGDSTKTMATSPSYLASRHADVLFGDPPFSLQTPIDCSDPDRGIITNTAGTDVNVCLNRCRYGFPDLDPPREGNSIVHVNGEYFGEACLDNTDCPLALTKGGETVTGRCTLLAADHDARFVNDANTVLKVTRDRECAEWLACSSSRASFNPQSGEYESICDRVGLCTKADADDPSRCAQWADSRPERLTEEVYANRDVSWGGKEYSGYAIANQYPADLYTQVNINPPRVCGNEEGTDPVYLYNEERDLVTCTRRSECGTGFDCIAAPTDFRLAVVAGPCTSTAGSAGGTECKVGFCRETDVACGDSTDCVGSASGNTCVFNYCALVAPAGDLCASDAECVSEFGSAFFCNGGQCQNRRVIAESVCAADSDCGTYGAEYTCSESGNCVFDYVCPEASTTVTTGCPSRSDLNNACIPSALTKTGACYNSQCLQDLDGVALGERNAEAESCRGYPEPNSPFAASDDLGVVDESGWEPDLNTTDKTKPPQPFTMRPGFDAANVCAPVWDPSANSGAGAWVAMDDCLCTYKKVQYGEGVLNRYYSKNVRKSSDSILEKVCSSGAKKGWACDDNDDCAESGQCVSIDRTDTLYGWSGYCLERDTSIQLNGRSEDALRPCLTWLPVDQLAGSTDLFGKYTEAGYNEGETYYCAETVVAADYKTSSGAGLNDGGGTLVACAETTGCDDGNYTEFIEDMRIDSAGALDDKGECLAGAYCPIGFFAVLSGCRDLAPRIDPVNPDSDRMCNSSGDSDCPYFCVPKKSKNENNQNCSDPIEIDDSILNVNVVQNRRFTRGDAFETWADEAYIINKDDFHEALQFYDGCVAKDIVDKPFAGRASNFVEYNPGWLRSEYKWATDATFHDAEKLGFYNMQWNIDNYLACQSVIRVAGEDSGDVVAWTDRVWRDSDFAISATDDARFAYPANAEQSFFGRVKPIADFSSVNLMRIVSCGLEVFAEEPFIIKGFKLLVLPRTVSSTPVDSDCPSLIGLEGGSFPSMLIGESSVGEDARAYSTAEVSLGTYTVDQNQADRDKQNLLGGYDADEEIHVVDYEQPRDQSGSAYPKVASRLRQIFAVTKGIFRFNDKALDAEEDTQTLIDYGPGAYEPVSLTPPPNPPADYNNFDWDVTARGDGTTGTRPSAPVVVPVEDCRGTNCYEPQPDDRGNVVQGFTVNNLAEGLHIGDDGFKHASVNFYTYANKNQMPIRNILVDWGDTHDLGPGVPERNVSGSVSNDNFYKNHRGLLRDPENGTDIVVCDQENEWGKTSESCSKSYVGFEHNYTCTDDFIAALSNKGRTCEDTDGDALPDNSPCLEGDACVYRPRVFVKDNWGWCTGYCPNGPSDGRGNTGCYDGAGDVVDGIDGINECNWRVCPDDDSTCLESDPWVYYKGQIIVTP